MITVIGSINMDIVATVKELPGSGETVMGESLMLNPGGKGANQAVAASKLGSNVSFLGCLGDDTYGDMLLKSLQQAGVDTTFIKRDSSVSSGTALIEVDNKGNNNIVVIPGANSLIKTTDIDSADELLQKSSLIMLQLEIPLETVFYVLQRAKRVQCRTILNPAPARELSHELLRLVDILVPNEHELQRITRIDCSTLDGVYAAGNQLLECGVRHVVVTLGKKGAALISSETHKLFPPCPAKAIDTTAAGDSFLGGFANMLERSGNIETSIEWGQRVAAYSIQRQGAQQSMPTLQDL